MEPGRYQVSRGHLGTQYKSAESRGPDRRATFASAGSLAAAAMAPNDVPQAVIAPIGPDPIYAVIERHRKAFAGHIEAVRVEFAFEEAHDIEGVQREEYERLYAATGAAWDTMDEAGGDLVNTRPNDAGRHSCALPVHQTGVRGGRSAGPA
jgi:hypothetical protein